MKNYIIIFLCAVVFAGFFWGESPQGATYFVFKKLSTNPVQATSVTKADLFFKYSGTAGDTGIYRRFADGTVKRIDTTFSTNVNPRDTSFTKTWHWFSSSGVATGTNLDSLQVIPIEQNLTFIAGKVKVQGGTSATVMLAKVHSGALSYLFASTVSVSATTITGSWTDMGTPQNTSFVSGDGLAVILRVASGSPNDIAVSAIFDKAK